MLLFECVQVFIHTALIKEMVAVLALLNRREGVGEEGARGGGPSIFFTVHVSRSQTVQHNPKALFVRSLDGWKAGRHLPELL